MQIVIDIPEEIYQMCKSSLDDAEYLERVIGNGVPLQETSDKENSEIKNKLKDLSERVENIEKQMKEDKEEQIKKLKAEMDYAKFRCALSTMTYPQVEDITPTVVDPIPDVDKKVKSYENLLKHPVIKHIMGYRKE